MEMLAYFLLLMVGFCFYLSLNEAKLLRFECRAKEQLITALKGDIEALEADLYMAKKNDHRDAKGRFAKVDKSV